MGGFLGKSSRTSSNNTNAKQTTMSWLHVCNLFIPRQNQPFRFLPIPDILTEADASKLVDALPTHRLHHPLQPLHTRHCGGEVFLGDRVVFRIAGLDIGAADAFEGAAVVSSFAGPGLDQAGVEAFGHAAEFLEVVELGAVEGERQEDAVIG